MFRRFITFILFLCWGAIVSWAVESAPAVAPSTPSPAPRAAESPAERIGGSATSLKPATDGMAAPIRVMVIPMRHQIDDPIFYILRRGLKEAVEQKYDVVVIDMDTPGGSLATTFEILEALEKFPGHTLTYINKDAISAGAFISAMTKEIYFAPNGVIGAAAPVSGGGQDIDATMKAKIVSYLKARVRSLSEGKGEYRGDVISSMLDVDYEFKIGDRVIKKKGDLLSLTAKEASETFGDPPQPLLAAGIAPTLEDLLKTKYGEGRYQVKRLEVTWSEDLAVTLNSLKPILLGLGLLALFIEFKLQGSGVFATVGLVLLGIVFLSSYVSGLSGHEPVLVFVFGLLLLLAELFFFPGVVVVALLGSALMLGSLLWAMADLWPSEPLQVAWSGDVFLKPIFNLLVGLAVALVGGLALGRFLPKRLLWDRLVLGATVAGQSQADSLEAPVADTSLVGQSATAVTALMPSGQVEVAGRRLEARLRVGSAPAGARLRVVAHSGFSLVVEKEAS